MPAPLISVITACFNDGIYLDESFSSIASQVKDGLFEHIIVNDGSTDTFTLQKLEALKAAGSVIINQENKGLGAARNTGIARASAKYIIPLDCDNKLVPEVILKAYDLLEKDPTLTVVYTDAAFFGDSNDQWKVGSFDHLRLFNRNFIDACALYRRSAWENAGGYDGNMPTIGHEDWEIWIHIFLNGGKFFYLEETGFHYRVINNSMSAAFTNEMIQNNRAYIFNKHAKQLAVYYSELYDRYDTVNRKLNNINKYLSANKLKAAIKLFLGGLTNKHPFK